MAQPESHNFRLISHDTMSGFGNVGEGMSLQLASGGRRIMWMAHECAPKNFTGVDVTDPTKPRVVVQTDLPHRNVRSNSLEVCGNIMAVAYQTGTHGATPAGIELFDISTPEQPRSVSFIDRSGPRSRGVHQLWFVDGKTIHCSSGAADFMPRNLKDDQCYTAFDVSDPAKPRELGRWWYPGTEERDEAPPVPRHPKFDTGCRAHNTNVYPERPDRAYVGYIDGGACVLDISDIGRPKLVGHWNPHPPFPGFTHTVMPLFDRDLLVVSDECVRTEGADWPKLVWLLDARKRGQSGFDRDVAAAADGGLRDRRALRRAQSAREPARAVVPVQHAGVRHVFRRRAARARHHRSAAAEGGGVVHSRPAGRLADEGGDDQRRVCR